MTGVNTAGFIMAGIIWRIFWKLRFIIYDNDVIRNISAGKNMAVCSKNRQIIPAVLIPGKVLHDLPILISLSIIVDTVN